MNHTWIARSNRLQPLRSTRILICLFALAPALLNSAFSATVPLSYAPAPPDNPLKGFVPYPRSNAGFPHSMEWDYTRLSDVMKGPCEFTWGPFEAKLNAAAARSNQFYTRFYMEWPGKKTGVPQYLIDAGLLMRRWTNTNTQPWPAAIDHTPDYEDPRLRHALTNFIHALGKRYDGDPRIGFIGLGLLGTWGEWHNHPNNDWFASKTVQDEVLNAYELAFQSTRLVARYPAGPNHYRYAPNHTRALGYHDDSFAWATLATGRQSDDWFFESLLQRAGALDKWRTQPIGGEVRPELWKTLFSDGPHLSQQQDFNHCVSVTHVSWLCNEGVFRNDLPAADRQRALRAAQSMGYELHVSHVDISPASSPDTLPITLTVTNTGVAPFYYNWPVELAAMDSQKQLKMTWKTPWQLTSVLPDQAATLWTHRTSLDGLSPGEYKLLIRVPNPMPEGRPLRFANRTQDQHLPDWLTLGTFTWP